MRRDDAVAVGTGAMDMTRVGGCLAGFEAARGARAQCRPATPDPVPLAALVVDAGGVVLHETPRLRALLATAAEASLRETMLAVARVTATRAADDPSRHEARTAMGTHRVWGTWLPAAIVPPSGAALVAVECVAVERVAPALPDADGLRARYGLTPREVEVARHVALGVPIADVAGLLGITRHTARHHVEAIRTKLGVRRASQVAAMLAGLAGEGATAG